MHAVFSVHVQTKELLFQECMQLERGLGAREKALQHSLAPWLATLLNEALESAPLLTQNTYGSCVSQRQETCLGPLCYSTRFSSRKEQKTTHAGPQPESQICTVPIKPVR